MNVQILTLFIAVGVGISVLWSNPRRLINQAFTVASGVVAVWLCLLWVLKQPDLAQPVPWLKAIAAVGAFFPWLLWWIGQCAIRPEGSWRDFFREGRYWMASALFIAGVAASNWYIPAESTPDHPLRGPGYLVYFLGLVIAYVTLVVRAVLELRRLSGIHLIEVRTLLIGGSVTGLAGLTITAVPPLLGLPSIAAYAQLAVLFFYALTVWSITSRRVFDAQHLFLAVLARGAVLVLASALMSLWLEFAANRLPTGVAMLLGLAACVSLIIHLEQQIRVPSFSGQARAAEQVRAAILSAGRDEVEPEALLDRYTAVLREWGRTSKVHIRLATDVTQTGNPWALAPDGPGLALLANERWVTPESLARRRVTPAAEELERFLSFSRLGVLVLSPQVRGATPIAVGLGYRHDGMPFLWPDIQHLLEWSELMEVAISRVQLTKRARETEQVATAGLLGASLAHEIRNPLVALKTFAQLLPERHHDPEFRDEFSRLLQKEVGRIEGLTEQLLKLSSPRKPVLRPIQVNDVVHECASLLKPKFNEAGVHLELDLADNGRPVPADSGSLHQVVLNLLVNATQALADRPGERIVRITTRLHPDRFVLEVADNGPGVPAKQRERLFQPFSSGKVNGFGLGLALSANIMRVHQGTIALVDTGKPGATFRITLPCPPS